MIWNASSDRAQTAQDFAVGIGIFLLTIAFVFAFLPTVLSPFDTDVGAIEQSQADRAVTFVTHNITEDGQSNHINEIRAGEFFGAVGSDVDGIQNATGTPFDARVNVTVTTLDGDEPVEFDGETAVAGPTYRTGEPAVSSSRILVADQGGECDPACELEVTVW